jgi:hypothetical protein
MSNRGQADDVLLCVHPLNRHRSHVQVTLSAKSPLQSAPLKSRCKSVDPVAARSTACTRICVNASGTTIPQFALLCRPAAQNGVQVNLSDRISVQVIKYYYNEISSLFILEIVLSLMRFH